MNYPRTRHMYRFWKKTSDIPAGELSQKAFDELAANTATYTDVGAMAARYGLTRESLAHAHPEAVVMHPGPINRGVEIESAVADGPRSLILDQVTNGIAVRMAVLSMAVSGQMKARAERRNERSRGAGA